MKNLNFYTCPNCQQKINLCIKKKNCYFFILKKKILVFTKSKTLKSLNYESLQSNIFYKNFLNWLFSTFKTNQKQFRKILFEDINLKRGQKILITGCGNGDDIFYLLKNKKYLKIFAQDLSVPLITSCFNRFKRFNNVFFNVSDAKKLPFGKNFFDHCFHFGGINRFGNYKLSLSEMERVTKKGGSITFGDEGIAPWLRGTLYSDMLINNNNLWKFNFKLDKITTNAVDVKIKYLLGNCFYLVNYLYNPDYKKNFDYTIAHKSPKGGSIISRYGKKTGIDKNNILKNLNTFKKTKIKKIF